MKFIDIKYLVSSLNTKMYYSIRTGVAQQPDLNGLNLFNVIGPARLLLESAINAHRY